MTSDDRASTTTLVLVGLAVALIAAWALAQPHSQAAEWSMVSLATAFFLAPWLFAYTDVTRAASNTGGAAAVIVAIATLALQHAKAAEEPAGPARKRPTGGHRSPGPSPGSSQCE